MYIYIYIERERDAYIYIYIHTHLYPLSCHAPPPEQLSESDPRVTLRRSRGRIPFWVFIKGGCSRRGVQWMGLVLYDKTACNIV